MKCKKCGNELSENAKFCGKCGTPVDDVQNAAGPGVKPAAGGARETAPGSTDPGMPADRESKAPDWKGQVKKAAEANDSLKKLKSHAMGNRKVIAIGAAAACVIIIVIVVAMNMKKTVNLNDYVEVEFSGYDTQGKATASIDEDALGAKITEVGKIPDVSDENALWEGIDTSDTLDIILAYFGSDVIDVDVTPADGLSNGDAVTVNIVYNEQLGAELGVKLKAEPEEFTVEGLEEATTIDPFEDISIEYEGFAPSLTLNIVNNSTDEYLSGLEYTADVSSGLRPGDKFTVTVDADADSAFDKGYILTETSKEFTCEGCNFYLEDIADINDDTLSKLKEDAEDILEAYFADAADSISHSGLEFVGYSIYNPKTIDSVTWYGNGIWLVYKTTVSHNEGSFEPTENYMTVRFQNLVEHADGNQAYDTGELLRGSTNIKFGLLGYVNGDTDSDRLYDDLVTVNQDAYQFSMDDGFKKLGEE